MGWGWERLEKGGIFEGFGMNEEGRRELGRERPNVYRRRFLGTVRLCLRLVHAPRLYLLSPSRCPSWCPGTEPDHMPRSVFGLQVHLMS